MKEFDSMTLEEVAQFMKESGLADWHLISGQEARLYHRTFVFAMERLNEAAAVAEYQRDFWLKHGAKELADLWNGHAGRLRNMAEQIHRVLHPECQ